MLLEGRGSSCGSCLLGKRPPPACTVATTLPTGCSAGCRAGGTSRARGRGQGNLVGLGADWLWPDGGRCGHHHRKCRAAARRNAGRRANRCLPPERLRVVEEATMEVRGATILERSHHRHRVSAHPLALARVNGRLFHSMALTVLFALMGAFVLTLTIVPVLASYFLMVTSTNKLIDNKVHAVYVPLRTSTAGALLSSRV